MISVDYSATEYHVCNCRLTSVHISGARNITVASMKACHANMMEI